VDNWSTGGAGRKLSNSQTPQKNTSFLGFLFQGQLEYRGARAFRRHGDWRKSAINFLLTDARSPGTLEMPGIAGRKRR